MTPKLSFDIKGRIDDVDDVEDNDKWQSSHLLMAFGSDLPICFLSFPLY